MQRANPDSLSDHIISMQSVGYAMHTSDENNSEWSSDQATHLPQKKILNHSRERPVPKQLVVWLDCPLLNGLSIIGTGYGWFPVNKRYNPSN